MIKDNGFPDGPLHVLHVITTIEIGGAENHLLTLLNELQRRGVTNTVVFLKGRPVLGDQFVQIGVPVIDKISKKNFLTQAYLIKRLVKARRFDLIHCHLPRAAIVSSMLPSSIPKIISFHNSERFNVGIFISMAVEAFLKETGELPKQFKSHVIHYGINPDFIRKEANDNTFSRFSEETFFRVGTISRLEKQKDLKTMIKGFSQLVHQGSDAHLFVVGTGSLLNELEALTMELRIDQRVHFLGKTNRALSFLSKLDVFVLTSQYEGFGLVLLEAMSLNVPIIATNASAIPEVLGVDHPGLFKLGDECDLAQKLYSTQEKGFRDNIINFQKLRLEKFSCGAMSTSTISLYEETVRDNI